MDVIGRKYLFNDDNDDDVDDYWLIRCSSIASGNHSSDHGVKISI